MKKIVSIVLAAAMIAGAAPKMAAAGDHGWAVAGKIMTGIIGLHILGNVIANSHPAPVYVPETRYYTPAPRERYWIEGHYETRMVRQWVPGHWEVVASRGGHDVDDEWGDDDGGSRRNWVPGHYRTVERQVWIDGHWEDRG
jgi:hypothetical protein